MYLLSKIKNIFKQAFNKSYDANLPILVVRNNKLIQIQKGKEDIFIKDVEPDI